MIPVKTKCKKFRLLQWSNAEWWGNNHQRDEPFTLQWEGFDEDNGTLLRGFKVLLQGNPWIEARKMEKEFRKEKIIITTIKLQDYGTI